MLYNISPLYQSIGLIMVYNTKLVKTLIKLLNKNGAKIAEAAKIKSPNYYSWMSGKDNALSDDSVNRLFEVLGIVGGQLDPNRIHRWFEDNPNGENIIDVFNRIAISNEIKANCEIHHIKTVQQRQFNIIKLNYADYSVLILCFNASPSSKRYPIDKERLKFGIQKDHFNISVREDIYEKWTYAAVNLDPQTTLLEIKECLPEEFQDTEFFINTSTVNSDQQITNDIVSELYELKAKYAGLRAVQTQLLAQMRAFTPDNALLDKKTREQIYKAGFQAELNKLNGKTSPNSHNDDEDEDY